MSEKENEYMHDSQGRLVPISQVKEIDKLRDELVIDLVEWAKKESGKLLELKRKMMDEVVAFINLSAEKYGVSYGGKKGNVSLTSYDGNYKVLIAIRDQIAFDERLQIAKDLIDGCIKRWSDGSRPEIIAIVQDAFNVDKTGKINTERILGLRRLDIQDEQWKQAMEAISDSIQVNGSKPYIRFYQRSEDGGYVQIPLDMTKL
jgi:hypothetical protein